MYCPMLKCQCHLQDCAWYKPEYGACSVNCLPALMDRLGDEVSQVAHYLELVEGKVSILGVVHENI